MVATLYYDEDCSFCSATTRFLEKWCGGKLRIMPYDTPEADEALKNEDPKLRYNQAWMVDEQGKIYGGPRAMWQCFYRLPGGFLLWPIQWIPGFWPMSGVIYRFIANRRTPECKLKHPTV